VVEFLLSRAFSSEKKLNRHNHLKEQRLFSLSWRAWKSVVVLDASYVEPLADTDMMHPVL